MVMDQIMKNFAIATNFKNSGTAELNNNKLRRINNGKL